MKGFLAVLTIILTIGFVFAVDDAPVLEFKSKIGLIFGKLKSKI